MPEPIPPSVSVAVICQGIEHGPDGLSLHGIVHSATVLGARMMVCLACVLHAGDLVGRYEVAMIIHAPDGSSASDRFRSDLDFRRPEEALYLALRDVEIRCPVGGVYWLEVSLADRVMLRRPLAVTLGAPETPPASSR